MLEKNNSYLEVANLSKSFGTFEAIKNISISIEEGEFVCFLGPSGCGKQPFLRCIAGLEIQSTGSVFQKNKDISNLPPSIETSALYFSLMRYSQIFLFFQTYLMV
ncbi:MAG: hypothetical protein CM1200mP5_2000 [Candidatus Pelagibacterales bacterium]|nr:MAG: hypothetical protein CM1200mP5_2000 [Pelagibacterales bacterium]